MTSVLIVLGGCVLALIIRSIVVPLLTDEILGGFDDRLKRSVREAAALLPADIADDKQEEWLEELAAFGARRLSAWRFARGLEQAAEVIASASKTVLASGDGGSEPVGGRWREATPQRMAAAIQKKAVKATSRLMRRGVLAAGITAIALFTTAAVATSLVGFGATAQQAGGTGIGAVIGSFMVVGAASHRAGNCFCRAFARAVSALVRRRAGPGSM
jgi:hypothetical protein